MTGALGHHLNSDLGGAIESISEGIALYDSDDRLVLCNGRYRDILSASRNIIRRGVPFIDILRAQIGRGQIAEAAGRAESFIAQRMKDHLNPQRSFELSLADGRWIRVQERKTRDGGIIAVLTEITERKLREQRLRNQAGELERFNVELIRENLLREATEVSLRESEARARAIFETAADGVITFDEHCLIEAVNPAIERMFGYAAEELVGCKVSMLMPCDACQGAEIARCGHIAGIMGARSSLKAIQGVRKDGGQLPLEWSISETRLKGGRIFTGIVRDVSERLKLEKMKSEFVSVVGHELRTPLTSIKGALAVLDSRLLGELPEKAASMVSIAYRNTDRLVRLINDILDIEKIESGTMPFEFQVMKPSRLLRQAADSNQGYADQFGAAIRLGGLADAKVMGDPDRLMQVLTNLISNAAKFSPKNGIIAMDAVPRGKTVRISVSDQGPGISKAFRDLVFEKFSQADSSDSRKLGGTGLGLNISKAIVERHGGKIGFETVPGKGTTFYFDLPRWRPERKRPGSGRERRRPVVLVCADDRLVRQHLESLISDSGYRVRSCARAATAKRYLGHGQYAAMTLDIALPKQGAVELIGAVRRDPETRDLPIVAVSLAAPGDLEGWQGRAFGIVDWLHTPIDPERLRHGVERAIAMSRRRRPRILHVEDDPDHIAIVSRIAGEVGDIEPARSCQLAREYLRARKYDLVILDLMLPDARGETLLPSIYQAGAAAPPVLIFSVREVPQKVLSHVAAALVKTKTSNELLVRQIRKLLKTGKIKKDIKLFA